MTSTVSDLLSRSHPVARLASFIQARAEGAGRIVRALVHRWEVAQLAEYDERALKDIGLIPNDIAGALAVPLTKDPSTVLMLRSVERRAQARAQAAAAERRQAADCGP
jgi:uncharacterized protein YjiS (DUF1127 family)